MCCSDGRRDGRKSFSWRDCRDLLIAAHQQLGGPIVLVWDNSTSKAADLQKFAEARDWLTICYLPLYTPDLNPRTHRRLPRRDRPDDQTH